ncbi:hypothetical protein BpHYR1_000270 [Brachionus plicatilis]|uniref:Uncharacterized protein n=1 Tax=Brachionus plicatilis TaxID=10195 RepID=A0A3M7QEZ9_BRAPC|nr:hypothetical protein BpHYR1_000270 [Brachionus plicatilis]
MEGRRIRCIRIRIFNLNPPGRNAIFQTTILKLFILFSIATTFDFIHISRKRRDSQALSSLEMF